MTIFVTSDIHGRTEVINKIIDFIKRRKDVEATIIC